LDGHSIVTAPGLQVPVVTVLLKPIMHGGSLLTDTRFQTAGTDGQLIRSRPLSSSSSSRQAPAPKDWDRL
jgi:hypothetical protein